MTFVREQWYSASRHIKLEFRPKASNVITFFTASLCHTTVRPCEAGP